jgi:hypothetical protein
MYAIISNGSIKKYPVDPRYEVTHVSFPENWSGGNIEGIEFVRVGQIPSPPCHIGWKPKEISPIFAGFYWKQQWTTEFVGFDELKKLIAKKRYDIETGGIKIGDYTFQTDRDAQTKYSIMALNKMKVNWKVNELEFVKVDMVVVDKLVRKHVQKCFDVECKYFDVIDMEDIDLIGKTDFDLGWPSNN